MKGYIITDQDGKILVNRIVKENALVNVLKNLHGRGVDLDSIEIIVVNFIGVKKPKVEINIVIENLVKPVSCAEDFLNSEDDLEEAEEDDIEEEAEEDEDPLFYKDPATGKQLKKANKKPGRRERVVQDAFPD